MRLSGLKIVIDCANGAAYRAAPDSIRRHYPAGETLLPVHLRPADAFAHQVSLRIGAVVKLPYRWPWERKNDG